MTIIDIRQALRAFLLADAAIATAVGGGRIYPLVLPQGVREASLVYTKVSGIGDYHMEGASGLARPRFQIDAWAPTADAADALGRLVKERLDGHRGVFGATAVQGAFCDMEREGYDAEAQLYFSGRDYMIWFNER